jgi:hypothetical protein
MLAFNLNLREFISKLNLFSAGKVLKNNTKQSLAIPFLFALDYFPKCIF